MAEPPRTDDVERCDVLVVGAGPTGLTLAAQLSAFDVSFALVDAAADRVHESRALAVQPRTLEVLRPFGIGDELVARGNRGVRLRITAGGRATHAPLFDIGAEDTAYPFLLFVSQAETEAVLAEHLAGRGVAIRRRVALEDVREDGDRLTCTLRGHDGTQRLLAVRYLVGCDGARSTVRGRAGIPFTGGRYPQTFVLADLAADGLEAGAVNTYVAAEGPFLFFPLGSPAPWRLITLLPPGQGRDGIELPEIQRLADLATGGRVRLHDPVWVSVFHVSHRGAARYRAGRFFLAGDAAHVHSPAGGQGMNTGIQDAVNLGWKLGLVCRGAAPDALLDSYDAERRPVGEYVLRFTDRAFTAATSGNAAARVVRARVVPRLLPAVLRLRPVRRLAFRTVSQLGIRYRRSPAVVAAPAGLRGPRPGDRLPDVRVARAGQELWLSEALALPAFSLLLHGPHDEPADEAAAELRAGMAPWLVVHRLVPGGDRSPGDADLVDVTGAATRRLGLRGSGWLLVRPDGHIAARAQGADLTGVRAYFDRWSSDGSRRLSLDSTGPLRKSRSMPQ
ncbi:FAD-dependent monooxygenase [Geodermatophilus sp. URMC 64]